MMFYCQRLTVELHCYSKVKAKAGEMKLFRRQLDRKVCEVKDLWLVHSEDYGNKYTYLLKFTI